MWASRRVEMPGEGCTSLPMVKPVCLPFTSPRVVWKFHGYKDENPSKNFFFHDPLVGYHISVVLFSCFKKFKCLGDVLASVSPPKFAKLRSQLLDVFLS